jgi:hypothetical protein
LRVMVVVVDVSVGLRGVLVVVRVVRVVRGSV